ncbi:heparinase II/III family protein [uncultured Dysgonomonas sp.]|uniref:Uncharacterized protein n=1 Tax=uncultured Dysgonomonas sp. TaxID=206096 RepID=A0A212JWA6_9BACT|nr:heparinase II/III family protein [uncultured Dysgonomonas sp.]SBW03658.1 conserved hypothetical protein [uncultured Dysgonomonas sp.]
MSKIIMFSIISLLFWGRGDYISAQQKPDFSFYTSGEINRIKNSANTQWGDKIIKKLEKTVAERLTHPLSIPSMEGGHGHDYFCPVHNTQFVFDWDSPNGHYCSQCGKKWVGVDKYDWAWVNFVHASNLNYLKACAYLFLAKGDKQYPNMAKNMLLDLASKYPHYKIHDRERRLNVKNFGGKMFAQSLDESVWFIDVARVYSVIELTLTIEEQQTICENLFKPSLDLHLQQRSTNNWQVWHNGAIAAMGVALRNDSIIDIALNKKDYGYWDMMSKNVYPDGWWNEGSVVYHFYPLRAILLTAEAVRCRNINLYDQKLLNMFSAPVNMLYPDLTFPSQNDGWYGISLTEQVSLYEIMAIRDNNPLYKSLLQQCYKQIERLSPEALVNGNNYQAEVTPLKLPSFNFDNLGVAILRYNGKTIVMKNGPYGGLHGHPDKLSISIHDGKSEILPDLGTTAYGVPDCQLWYQKTFAHNTVTVDGENQKKADCTIKRFNATKESGMIEADANNAYNGVNMSRKLKFENNTLKDLFVCTSETEHTYDYTLILTEPIHFNGEENARIIENYSRVSEAKYKQMKNSFEFQLRNAKVKIKVNGDFEIILGKAPGIPPTGTRQGKDAYPLFIRVKGKNMHIETIWQFIN